MWSQDKEKETIKELNRTKLLRMSDMNYRRIYYFKPLIIGFVAGLFINLIIKFCLGVVK